MQSQMTKDSHGLRNLSKHTRDSRVHRKDLHIILWLTFAMTVQARQLSIFKFDWLLLYIKKISGSHRYLTYFILKYLHIFTLIRIYKKLKNYYKLKKLRKKLKVKKTKCVELDCVILTFNLFWNNFNLM